MSTASHFQFKLAQLLVWESSSFPGCCGDACWGLHGGAQPAVSFNYGLLKAAVGRQPDAYTMAAEKAVISEMHLSIPALVHLDHFWIQPRRKFLVINRMTVRPFVIVRFEEFVGGISTTCDLRPSNPLDRLARRRRNLTFWGEARTRQNIELDGCLVRKPD